MDIPDGTYESPLKVRLTAVSNLSGATIVYTLDGSEPTAESSQVADGTILNIESSCTLRAGILSGGKVYGIQQRDYQIFQPHDITLYVRSDISWTGTYFYAWDNQDKQLSGNWPGKRVTTTKSINGKRWFYQTYRLTSPTQYINLVVSGSSGKQTIDIMGLKSDSYLCITGTQDNGKYIVEDQTAETETAIGAIHNSQFIIHNEDGTVYDLSGRKTNSSPFILHSSLKENGVFVVNGKKFLQSK